MGFFLAEISPIWFHVVDAGEVKISAVRGHVDTPRRHVFLATTPTVKYCAYCGHENSDDAPHCSECDTEEFQSTVPMPAVPLPKLEFTPLSPAEMQNAFVTLTTCRTLVDADLIVSQLESTGITAFIPDQLLMQAISWNLNTYGFVRVQVSPNDYAAAKEFLSPSPEGA